MPKPALKVPLIFHPSTFIHKPFLLTFRGSQLPLELLIMTGSLSIPNPKEISDQSKTSPNQRG